MEAFLIKLFAWRCNFANARTLSQLFFREFHKIFQNDFFERRSLSESLVKSTRCTLDLSQYRIVICSTTRIASQFLLVPLVVPHSDSQYLVVSRSTTYSNSNCLAVHRSSRSITCSTSQHLVVPLSTFRSTHSTNCMFNLDRPF